MTRIYELREGGKYIGHCEVHGNLRLSFEDEPLCTATKTAQAAERLEQASANLAQAMAEYDSGRV